MGMNQAPSDTQSWWPEGEATPTAETNFLDAWVTRQVTWANYLENNSSFHARLLWWLKWINNGNQSHIRCTHYLLAVETSQLHGCFLKLKRPACGRQCEHVLSAGSPAWLSSSSSITPKPPEPNSIPDDLPLPSLSLWATGCLPWTPTMSFWLALPPISSYNILFSMQQPERSISC